MRLITTILFVFFISIIPLKAESNEVIALKGPAPISFLTLDCKNTIGGGIAKIPGPHGMERKCFKAKDAFLVLEKNVVGEGYEIASSLPTGFNKLQCRFVDEHLKNNMDMTVGTTKSDVEKKLNVELPWQSGTVRWYSKKMFKSIEFDVQTTAKFKFSDNKIMRLYVFTTITN